MCCDEAYLFSDIAKHLVIAMQDDYRLNIAIAYSVGRNDKKAHSRWQLMT